MINRELAHIPLSQMTVTAINMRHDKKAPDIADILPSIRERGVLQSLLVRKNGDSYEVAAGRRRYYCLKTLAEETGEEVSAPCLLLEDGDDAAAIEASLLENLARQDADEMTAYYTYARLIAEGRTPADIARTFGIETKLVEKRLAIGRLDPAIRRLFSDEQISVDEIRALTLASPKQQKAWLKLFKAGEAPRHAQVRKWLLNGQTISVSVALFPLEDYKGALVTDLFNESQYFADADAFWERQNAAIAARRDKMLKKGWSAVEVLAKGEHFNSYQYERVSKKNGGKAFFEVHNDGSVTLRDGYLSRNEAKRVKNQDRAGAGETAAATPDRAELTQAQTDYIKAHRQAGARAALIDNPTMAFRLMVAHAISGNQNFRVSIDAVRGSDLEASIEGNACHQAFTVAQEQALALLGLTPKAEADEEASEDDDAYYFAHHEPKGLTGRRDMTQEVFVKLLALDNLQVMQIAAVVMAEALVAGSNAVEAVNLQAGVSLAGKWQPDALFWEQLRDREVIGAMLVDAAGQEVADSKVSATGKVKKALIQEKVEQQGESWLPRWLTPKPQAYTNRSGFGAPEQIAKLAGIFPVS